MKRRLLLLFAVASIAAFASAPLAVATPPEGVTITIDETFHSSAPFVTGDITAAGGVFGAQTTGTLASVAFKPVVPDQLRGQLHPDEHRLRHRRHRWRVLRKLACKRRNRRLHASQGHRNLHRDPEPELPGGRHRLDHAGRGHAYRLISGAPPKGDCPQAGGAPHDVFRDSPLSGQSLSEGRSRDCPRNGGCPSSRWRSA